MAFQKGHKGFHKKSNVEPATIITAESMSGRLKEIDEQRAILDIQRMDTIQKAMQSGTPLDMLRANDELSSMNKKSNGDRRTYTFDPFSGNQGGLGFKDSPSNISDSFLRGMARTHVIRATIDTRQNQLSNFSRPTIDQGTAGWTIRKKRGVFEDANKELTDAEKREIDSLIKFISNCGIADDKNKYDRYIRHTFESFLRETVRDSLTLDNLAFECLENRRGDLTGFVSVDGATVRYTDEMQYFDEKGIMKPEFERHGQHPMYVQMYNSRPIQSFYSWEMCLGIRNKHTDITQNGYGISELEDLVRIITWMLYGDSYNGKFFSQGAAPKGILKVMGNVNNDRLNEFKMYWQQMVSGVANAWRTPVLESDKIEWIDLQKSNQDMQFYNWLEYLIRLSCAVFKIAPEELGFSFGNGSGSSGGEQYSSHKQKTDYSKDKGLIPVMRHYEEIMNKYIVQRHTDKYEFAWTGITIDDEASTLDMDVKQVQNWMTIDEMRAKRKLPPLPNGEGKIVLNSVYMSSKQMALMGNQQSNSAVNQMTGEEDDNNDENPFDSIGKGAADELNRWIEEGMPSTLQKIL